MLPLLAILGGLVFFGVVLAGRLWLVPDGWWNWLALILWCGGAGAAWMMFRQRGRSRESRWFSLRPGVAAVAGLILLFAWLVIRIPAPMGDGPAGPDVPAQAFTQTWSERPVLMLALGDSVSTGYGAPPGHGYFDLVLRNAEGTYPEMAGCDLHSVLPNARAIRLAANSTNSIEHLRVIESLPVYDEFGIVCITTGGIDLIHMYGKAAPREGAMYGATWQQAEAWVSNFRARLDVMMLALHGRFPEGCIVMLATIYEPTDGVGDIENAGPMFWMPAWPDGERIHTAFNDAIKDCAAAHDHVHLADMHAVLLGHGIHCRDRSNPHYDADDPSYWFWINLEDPNRRGYDAIRRVFLNGIIDALSAEPGFDVPGTLPP